MSKPEVEKFKSDGDAAFRAGNNDAAIQSYSKAIELDPSNVALYSNRSAAFAKKYSFEDALKDAEKALQINPKFARGHQRKGAALFGLGRFEEAATAYKKGLEFEPENAQIKQGLQEANNAASQAKETPRGRAPQEILKSIEELFKGDVGARIKAMPEVSHLASDNAFMKKVEEIQKDSSKLREYLGDPQMTTYISYAMEYQRVSKMTPEERAEAIRQQEEERMREEKAAEARREAQRKKEKEEKEALEKKKKEEELAKMTPEQKKALEVKEKANGLFNLKKFEEALKLYEECHSLDPKNIVYLNNISAAYMELKQYDKVIEISIKAIEIGRSNHAPYEMIGRALQRIGTANFRKGDYESAIEAYKKSLTEHRDATTLNLQKKAEAAYEEKKKQDYINPELSEKAKKEANESFRQQKYAEAVAKYTEAFKRNPSDHTILSNRASAYIKLMALPEALKDSEQCIALKPDFVKGYLRKGQVHFMMKEYQKCLSTYEKALEFEPDNKELSESIAQVMQAINSGGPTDAEAVKRNLQSDPELQNILRDPMMQQVLKDLQENPKSIARYMQDEQIKANIEKLVAAGVIGTR